MLCKFELCEGSRAVAGAARDFGSVLCHHIPQQNVEDELFAATDIAKEDLILLGFSFPS